MQRILPKFENVDQWREPDSATGFTPLAIAARWGRLEIVEELIRKGHEDKEISRVRTRGRH
jgi:hypothetical protein